jgi:spore maturation protein CgeB
MGAGRGNISEGSAYSVSPRIIEAAACGAFQLSDYRKEIVDVFGESVPTFSSPAELREMVLYYLSHEEEMKRLSLLAEQKVRQYSYKNRSAFMLNVFSDALTLYSKKTEEKDG